MNNDYGEIENKMLLYKSKETIVKEHIELLKRIDEAIEYINVVAMKTEKPKYFIKLKDTIWGEELLDILKEVK